APLVRGHGLPGVQRPPVRGVAWRQTPCDGRDGRQAGRYRWARPPSCRAHRCCRAAPETSTGLSLVRTNRTRRGATHFELGRRRVLVPTEREEGDAPHRCHPPRGDDPIDDGGEKGCPYPGASQGEGTDH